MGTPPGYPAGVDSHPWSAQRPLDGGDGSAGACRDCGYGPAAHAAPWPAPTEPEPDAYELEDMADDAIATDGCSIEPDGVCEHGHPSWLLALGYI